MLCEFARGRRRDGRSGWSESPLLVIGERERDVSSGDPAVVVVRGPAPPRTVGEHVSHVDAVSQRRYEREHPVPERGQAGARWEGDSQSLHTCRRPYRHGVWQALRLYLKHTCPVGPVGTRRSDRGVPS